jgi:hypothetical protein
MVVAVTALRGTSMASAAQFVNDVFAGDWCAESDVQEADATS